MWDHAIQYMSVFRFDRMLYGRTHFAHGANLGESQDFMVLSSHSDSYFEEYVLSGVFKRSPFLLWSLDNLGTKSWSYRDLIDLTPQQLELCQPVLEVNRRHGVNAGFTISFDNSLPGQKSIVAICAEPGMSQEEVDVVLQAHQNKLEAYWKIFDLKARSLPFPNVKERLTRRQREVLYWCSQGKTTEDISIILGLHPTTIEKHLSLARRALGVVSTAQAITKLSFLNHLFIDVDSQSNIKIKSL